ncbi:uncharacterized protein EAF01_005095 [Botrytis porri]|uniref:uncharacterized protein n=1 Tax=Botrytis porri TaxID=87229 RepID=UPI001900B4B1|nr:uncharacterized protein EAF01_005095 [Botrytis porri]KAF7907509.1 hypothetical protein EAF01_005095 [Botrytis porri]
MPPKRKPSSTPPLHPPCTHPHVLTTSHPSSQFPRVSASRRAAATTASGIHKTGITDTYIHDFVSDLEFASTFPAPLVLQGDALEIDAQEPGQNFRAWERGKHRNAVPGVEEGGRRIIYVVGPPGMDGEEIERFMKGWEECEVGRGGDRVGDKGVENEKMKMDGWMLDVVFYLQAFYHGLPVKQMDSSLLQFTPWEDTSPSSASKSKSSKAKPKSRTTSKKIPPTYISLRTSTFKTGIRYRLTPSSPFTHQLNLSDLLDLAIDILPSDAYALLMLVNHDLYEDDDDEFVCGRAYGESRVAVVSTARYRPELDAVQGIEGIHAWPGSHCIEYMNEVCGIKKGKRKRGENEDADKNDECAIAGSPLARAVTQQNTLPPLSLSLSPIVSEDALKGLFLSRICRTASHELGHCFGIAHCPYYACCMQGSASIQEDARQPPYLCPVDLKKVVMATGADVRRRYEALLGFCESHGSAHMFVAFGEWIRGRLEQIERVERGEILDLLG